MSRTCPGCPPFNVHRSRTRQGERASGHGATRESTRDTVHPTSLPTGSIAYAQSSLEIDPMTSSVFTYGLPMGFEGLERDSTCVTSDYDDSARHRSLDKQVKNDTRQSGPCSSALAPGRAELRRRGDKLGRPSQRSQLQIPERW